MTPPRSKPPAPLRFLSPLHKASRQIAIHLQGRTAPLGVSPGEGHLLAYAAFYGPCPVGELSRVFGMSKSTLTGVLDRLVEAGLVGRSVNGDDRRSFVVAVTPPGRRLAVSLRALVESLERDIATRLTDADSSGFRRVMDAIAQVTQVEVRPGRTSGPRNRRKSP